MEFDAVYDTEANPEEIADYESIRGISKRVLAGTSARVHV
jgi:hypothetical protein